MTQESAIAAERRQQVQAALSDIEPCCRPRAR